MSAELPRPFADGRYTLLSRLGTGGMADVYEAMDHRLDRAVAVKILRGPGGASPLRQRRLHKEARALGRVEHPGVVQVLDIGDDPEGSYLVLRLVRGGTLFDQVELGPLAPSQAVWIVAAVLDALQAAHDAGIVHRDVKPSNVLLDDEGRPLLTDFGIALLPDEGLRQTKTGVSMGSMSYMAPEQRIDARSVGPAADIYAAACTLFFALTAGTPVDLFTAGEQSPRWVDVPQALRPALYAATRHDPAARPASAAELAAMLRAAVGAMGPSADEVPSWTATTLRGPALGDSTIAGATTSVEMPQAVRAAGWRTVVLASAAAVTAGGLLGAIAVAWWAPPPEVVSEVVMVPAPESVEVEPVADVGVPDALARTVEEPPQATMPPEAKRPPLVVKKEEVAPKAPQSSLVSVKYGAAALTSPVEWRRAVATGTDHPWAGRWRGSWNGDQTWWVLSGDGESVRGTRWTQSSDGGRIHQAAVAGACGVRAVRCTLADVGDPGTSYDLQKQGLHLTGEVHFASPARQAVISIQLDRVHDAPETAPAPVP